MTEKKWEDRQTKRIPLPPTSLEIDRYESWRDSFAELREEGFERGWLDYGNDGYFETGPRPSGHEERPETDEEYEKRMKNPMARAMWEMSRGYVEQLKRESHTLKRLITDNAQTVFPVAKRGDNDVS